jgi:hypothetical protein
VGLPAEVIKALRRECRKRGKRLISIGYRNYGCDRNLISPGPFEWLSWINHADLVVTSMYHGTLLSIQLQRPFLTHVTPYRANKLNSVLSLCGLKSRILDPAKLEAQFDAPVDWSICEAGVGAARKDSIQFLKESLQHE